MIALGRSLEQIRTYTWREAVGACLAIDAVRTKPGGDLFQEVQAATVRGLLTVEARMRQLRRRKRSRGPRVKYRLERKPALRLVVGQHNAFLSTREELLAERREMFRQVGDALAWLMLRGDQRRLRLLFVEGRTHELPEGIGLAAAIEVARKLNSSGAALAGVTDITRCLGAGDVVVVGKDNAIPLCLELKSTSISRSSTYVGFYAPYAESGPVRELFDLVSDILGLEDDTAPPGHDGRTERQVHELIERTDFTTQLAARLVTKIREPSTDHWSSLRAVLERAYLYDSSFDILEPGIMAVAVRLQPGDQPSKALLRISEKAKNISNVGENAQVVTTADLLANDMLSPFIMPIPLWPVTGDLRSALMASKLYLAIIVESEVWTRVFRDIGGERIKTSKGWTVRLDDQEMNLDPLEVAKLTLGVGISGLSAQAVAEAIRDTLARESS